MNRYAAALLAALSLLPPAGAQSGEVKTSKERLSTKASDEQRIDNCRVPPAQRGSIARPGCAAEASGPARSRQKERGPEAAPGASRR